MATVLNYVQNDTAPAINFTVKRSGAAVDLTGATVAFKIQKPDASGRTNDGHNSCTLVTATAGTCTYTFIAGDLANVGANSCDLEITYSSGKVETGFDPIVLNVRSEV